MDREKLKKQFGEQLLSMGFKKDKPRVNNASCYLIKDGKLFGVKIHRIWVKIDDTGINIHVYHCRNIYIDFNKKWDDNFVPDLTEILTRLV